MATKNNDILIQPFGGLADSKYSGAPDSLEEIVGWDMHKLPGILNVRQALTKDSGTTVTEFVKVQVACTDGNTYHFSSTSGKVWKRTSGGTWSLVYTMTAEKGGVGCLGAIEFQGWIYIATEKRLHRIKVSGTSDWTTNMVLNWAQLNLDQAEIGGTAFNYALTTAVNEGATHRNTFTPQQSPQEGLAINVLAKGTGNWTVKVHDAANVEVASSTIAAASMANGWVYFDYASLFYPTLGTAYHIHVYSSVADGTVNSNTTTNLEAGNIRYYTTSDSEFHPMIEQNLVLFIGDRHLIHQVEAGVFSRSALDVNPPLRVKSLGIVDTDILIGTYIADNVNKTRVYRWNTFSVSFTSSDPIEEVGINAFFQGDNYVIVNAGQAGNLYTYNGAKLELFKTLPGDYSPTKYGAVHPNAVANLQGQILFGFSNGSGDPTDEGVYCLGRHNRNYPLVMDLSFPISERSGSDFVLTGLEIGSILVIGSDLLVAWKHGSAYGVDKLDYSTKLNGAYLKTRSMIASRISLDTFSEITLAHEPMPASCGLAISVALNNSSSYTSKTVKRDDLRNITFTEGNFEATRLQVKVTATTNSNNAPTLELINIPVGGQ